MASLPSKVACRTVHEVTTLERPQLTLLFPPRPHVGMESTEFGFETPVGGSGQAKDVGSAALALVVNRFINGESILVDGGTLLVHPSKY